MASNPFRSRKVAGPRSCSNQKFVVLYVSSMAYFDGVIMNFEDPEALILPAFLINAGRMFNPILYPIYSVHFK